MAVGAGLIDAKYWVMGSIGSCVSETASSSYRHYAPRSVFHFSPVSGAYNPIYFFVLASALRFLACAEGGSALFPPALLLAAKGLFCLSKVKINQKMMKSAMIKDLYSEIDRLKQEVYAAREKNRIYIPKDRYLQDEAEKKAMAEKIERMELDVESRDKQFVVLQELYKSQQLLTAELSDKLDKTEIKLIYFVALIIVRLVFPSFAHDVTTIFLLCSRKCCRKLSMLWLIWRNGLDKLMPQ
ncbi:uncharacterized protein LOC113773483 [Coffea eugenioides]|uniref:uncharacterized protein LOC113773483 n=1 Tax=Coffea eugenioides TaxID=49369 RepID=UPI000F61466C|nr:uncharacterized protein LOC113773483 [Coffea eugenioides]